MQSIAITHSQDVEDIYDYWNALVTAVLQNIMQLKDIMAEHESASEAEFKQLYESLDCTSIYQVQCILIN